MVNYDESGCVCNEKVNKVVAREEVFEDKVFYKVLGKSGRLYKKDVSVRDKKEGWRLVSVNQDCFQLYLEYLKTNKEYRYNEATRKL